VPLNGVFHSQINAASTSGHWQKFQVATKALRSERQRVVILSLVSSASEMELRDADFPAVSRGTMLVERSC
jgi:hypothetical protein